MDGINYTWGPFSLFTLFPWMKSSKIDKEIEQ